MLVKKHIYIFNIKIGLVKRYKYSFTSNKQYFYRKIAAVRIDIAYFIKRKSPGGIANQYFQ